MKTIAILATYPARVNTFPEALQSVATQVDEAFVILNQYDRIPEGSFPRNAQFIIPQDNLKDTGKFFVPVEPDDFVVLCDDDIVYPKDYVSSLRAKWEDYSTLHAVVGVHGVIYSDFFDGNPQARIVHVFHCKLDADLFVNQLGTGTVLCKGYQLPPFEFMQTSARFVDVRFARHCAQAAFPQICVARENDWMHQLPTETSIFNSFTTGWDLSIVREVQSFAGLRFLPTLLPANSILVNSAQRACG